MDCRDAPALSVWSDYFHVRETRFPDQVETQSEGRRIGGCSGTAWRGSASGRLPPPQSCELCYWVELPASRRGSVRHRCAQPASERVVVIVGDNLDRGMLWHRNRRHAIPLYSANSAPPVSDFSRTGCGQWRYAIRRKHLCLRRLRQIDFD